MNLLKLIFNYGIGEDTGIRKAEKIKSTNMYNLVASVLFFIAGVVGLAFSIPEVALINFSALLLFSVTYLIFPPHKMTETVGFVGLLILSLAVLLCYFMAEEVSRSVLIFAMLFPIASISVMPGKGIWIAVGLLILMILGNIFPLTPEFQPMDLLSLTLFAVAYLLMIATSAIIQNYQEQNILAQQQKVEYYEQEINQRDEFIARLSHKLRTSLSNITLINNLVHDARMSSAQIELLETLKNSTHDLINDVNDLVEIATPSIIDHKQSILSFNLEEAIRGITEILSSDALLEVQFSTVIDPVPEYNIIGDPSLLRSVMINLVKGIAEFGLKDDQIAVSVSSDYETQHMYGLKFMLHFEVERTREFEQAVTASAKGTEQQPGMFTITNRLLQLTGAKVELQSGKSKQMIFFYQDFPKDLTRKAVKEPGEQKPVVRETRKQLKDMNILLVEDNAINQKIVLLSLNKTVKNIDVANNGKEALDMFGTKKYDLILMDIQMPVMDGITATKKVREIETTSEDRVPIIAITANALAGDRDHCLAAGADDYLSKPFQVEELVERIESLI